jgi:hypothetical protein
VTAGGQITAEAVLLDGISTLFQCQAAAPTPPCPCNGLTAADTTWSDPFVTTSCSELSNGDVILSSAPGAQTLRTQHGGALNRCIVTGETPQGTTSTLVLDIKRSEVRDCSATLRQIAANDGVTCQ